MKCELNIGFKWDEDSQTIIDWEQRTPCPNDAIVTYIYKLPSFKGAKTCLCEKHAIAFKDFEGTLEKL